MLSIFPVDVAHAIQEDLKREGEMESDFRQLHISRSEDVRYSNSYHSCIQLKV